MSFDIWPENLLFYIPASIICLFDLGSIKYYVYGIMKLANCDIKRNDVVFMVQVTSKTYA